MKRFVFAALSLTACVAAESSGVPSPGASTHPSATAAPPTVVSQPAHGIAHQWGYAGAEGPDSWAALDPAFAACANETTQSPIALVSSMEHATSPSPLGVSYKPMPLRLFDSGRMIQMDTVGSGATLKIGSETLPLVQFHFHRRGEHTIDGKGSDLEIHFVHKADNGRLTVIGILADRGAENVALAPVFSHLPGRVTDAAHEVPEVTLDLSSLFAQPSSYFTYEGSLTMPPCTEGVRWLVLTKRTTISDAQLAALVAELPHENARSPRSIGGRRVLRVEAQ